MRTKGSSIKYVRKIFRKTSRGLELLVFRKILRTYLMVGPKLNTVIIQIGNNNIIPSKQHKLNVKEVAKKL